MHYFYGFSAICRLRVLSLMQCYCNVNRNRMYNEENETLLLHFAAPVVNASKSNNI